MADDTSALCNSNKNHLQLTLEQPTKYAEDIETGGTFPDTDDENPDGNEAEGDKGGDAELGDEDKEKSKVPLLYQVEPGCTPLSCYSAILTFIVMTIGIFWLLLISPPKNSVPVPIPGSETVSDAQVLDLDEAYDDGFSSLPLTTTSVPKHVNATGDPSATVSSGEGALDRILRVVKDSGA